jgi:hypothetical protein
MISPTSPLYTTKRELSIALDLARRCKHRPHLSRAAPRHLSIEWAPCSPTISQLGTFSRRFAARTAGVALRVFVPAHGYPRKARPSEPRPVGSDNSVPDPTTHSALHYRSLQDQHTGKAPIGRSPRLRDRFSALSVSASNGIGLSTANALPRPIGPTLPTVGRYLRYIAQPATYRDLPKSYPDGDYQLAASLGELPCSLAREFGR